MQRQAAQPSEDLQLHDAVRHHIVSRQADAAAAAMTRLLQASRDRMLRYTVKP
jgi:DNA-binding FadR family transcriptional regulator